MTGFAGMILALAFMFTMPYAAAQSEFGGGSVTCEPPTLGLNTDSKSIVENGFTINGQAYDVESFTQGIPATSLKVGDKNQIILNIHEDTGSNNVMHVGLAIVTPQDNPKLTEIKSSIEWEKDHEGLETVKVIDSNNMLKDVTVDAVIDDDAGLTIMTLSFNTSEQLEPVALKVTTWDRKLCSWTNTFELIEDESSVDAQILQEEMELSKKLLENTDLTCGINIVSSTNLNYGQLEAGVLSSESQIVIENVGNTDATLFVKATPWKDDLNVAQIAVDNTRFSINPDTDFASMTPTSQYDTKIGSISPETSLTTFWKVQTDLLNSEFQGSLSQTIEFATSC